MLRVRSVSLLYVSCSVLGVESGLAQDPLNVLAAIDSVDAQINLTWDTDITRLSENTVRSRLQTVLELELRRNDIVVATAAPNFLNVDLVLLDNADGSLSYSYGVHLSEQGIPWRLVTEALLEAANEVVLPQGRAPADSAREVERTQAGAFTSLVTWWASTRPPWMSVWSGDAGVVTVGRNNLEDALEETVRELAEDFINARLASR